MTGHADEPADRHARARSDEEPGAHSGRESQAQERSIPGTASAKEGYDPRHGTAAGEPLEGVETDEEQRGDGGPGAG